MSDAQTKSEEGNDWSKWQEFILHELRRVSSALEDVQAWVLEMRLHGVRPEDWRELKDEVKRHDERLDTLEGIAKIVKVACAFLAPIVVWAIIEIIKTLLNR